MSEDESASWRWADADGVQSVVDEWDLVSSLSTGALPPYTLVWKAGWADWLPACQVAELATAVPKDKVEPAVEPKLELGAKEPPPPPTDKYQGFKARDAAAKLLGKRSSIRTPAPPPTALRIETLRGANVSAPPAPPRPAQPTLVEGQFVPATVTLRPPGAVPPPPHAVPPPAPVIEVIDSGPVSAEQPTNPQASAAPLPSWSDDVESQLRGQAAAAAGTPAPPGATAIGYTPGLPPVAPGLAGGRRSPLLLLGGLAGGLALLALVAIAAVVLVRSRDAGRAAGSSSGAAATAGASKSVRPCKIARAAERLAASAHPPVAPIAAPIGDRIGIGFAASEREAVGLVLAPGTLAAERSFEKKTERDISGVLPLAAGGFEVDVEGAGLRSPRTLDTSPRFAVGMVEAGVARQTSGAEPITIWPSSADQKTTEPRLASVPGRGHALTFRRGGQTGQVMVGWLDEQGARASDLAPLDAQAQVGTPAIGASEHGVLIAFASRPSDDAYWGLRLAPGAVGALPKSVKSFAVPPGGPGADAISPTVDAVRGGGWLLQWTEGATGRRQVRLQTLGNDLIPVGDPVTVSPEEANAGQGVVMVRGANALSLFLVKKGKGHELWGALLSCP